MQSCPKSVDYCNKEAEGEKRLLFARNKWPLSHQEGKPASRGAWVGLKGENISIG